MARADRVPFVPAHRLVAVWTTLNGLGDFMLLVDSGAERVVLSRRVAARLRLDLGRPLRLEALAGVGQSPPVPVVRLDLVQVGASVAAGLEASIYDLPPAIAADGLLGLNFLRRFRVTFEFDSRTLVLREPPARTA